MTKLSRQALYEQIKASSKASFIVKEMKRLGFWGSEQPKPARDLAETRSALQREITELAQQLRDPAAALKAVHAERMAQARMRRTETRIQREVNRYQRALAWHRLQQERITSLGDAARFGDRGPGDSERLQAQKLPLLTDAASLAAAAGVSLNELRFLTYARKVSRVSHYQRFALSKKTGGTRLISAPMPRLKRLQYWILDNLLMPLAVSQQAHGFVPGRSILSNAEAHTGQAVLINLDLRDFFPSLSYPRVKGLFRSLGYGDEIATLLSLLCTEADTQEAELDGERFFIAGPQRRLPQGAPTSPALSNLICRRLDRRLLGLARRLGYSYTRYADDLSFSGPRARDVEALLRGVATIVSDEGFTVHPAKTRVMRKGRRMEVTGLVVNQAAAIPRKTLRRFRALLQQIGQTGPEGKTWGESPVTGPALLLRLEGFARYVAMVHPEQGKAWLRELAELRRRWPCSQPMRPRPDFRRRSAAGELPLPGQQVAPVTPPPRLEALIQHREVEAAVRERLGLPAASKPQEQLP